MKVEDVDCQILQFIRAYSPARIEAYSRKIFPQEGVEVGLSAVSKDVYRSWVFGKFEEDEKEKADMLKKMFRRKNEK